MKRYKKFILITVVLAIASITLLGCDDSDVKKESEGVGRQQDVYNENQPAPFFDWSMPRSLWNDFYVIQNKTTSTWSYIQPMTGGRPLFETPSMGYPIPMDTQLTNPLRYVYTGAGPAVVEQPEPNGLFTSKNTDATIVMATNGDGTVSPVYTEQKVTCFPFPVKWVGDHWERVSGEPTIKLTPKTHK